MLITTTRCSGVPENSEGGCDRHLSIDPDGVNRFMDNKSKQTCISANLISYPSMFVHTFPPKFSSSLWLMGVIEILQMVSFGWLVGFVIFFLF